MSIFKRVNSDLPSSVENAFFEESINTDDKFANLKKNANIRTAKLQEYTAAYELEQKNHTDSYNWNEAQNPAVFEDIPYSASADAARRSFKQDDWAIRRSETFDDSEARYVDINSPYKTFAASDYMSAIMGASIWNPDMEEISRSFTVDTRSKEDIINKQVLAEKRSQSHNDWEEKQISILRKTNVVPSRGHAIFRTAAETTVASKFGLPDIEQMDKSDQQRIAMAESERERRLSIKRQGFNQNANAEMWANPDYHKAKTINDIYDRIPLIMDNELED